MMSQFAESTVEDAALSWLASSGFPLAHGPDIAIGQPGAERADPTYRDVVLEWRLREALVRLNPDLPQEALDDAFRKILRAEGPSLIERNQAVHRMLVDGVTVEYRRADGSIAGAQARVIDTTWCNAVLASATKACLVTPNSVAVTHGMLAILTPRSRDKVFR